MSVIYTFNGKDITMTMCMVIRAIVNVFIERLSISFEDALMLFYHSDTYKTLRNTENALWAELPQFIADRYFNTEYKRDNDDILDMNGLYVYHVLNREKVLMVLR